MFAKSNFTFFIAYFEIFIVILMQLMQNDTRWSFLHQLYFGAAPLCQCKLMQNISKGLWLVPVLTVRNPVWFINPKVNSWLFWLTGNKFKDYFFTDIWKFGTFITKIAKWIAVNPFLFLNISNKMKKILCTWLL